MGGGYRNGEVPESWLITFASGWNRMDGAWTHSLPPSTYRKHLALVALAKSNTGRDLRIGEGWCAYRPLAPQVMLKKRYGIMAATPGTSSHGLFWEGAQVAAIDYSNWSHVYGGDRAAFYRDVRAVGFEPDQISPRRGYPDEPWHVIDRDPWAPVPAGTELPLAEPPLEDDDMLMLNITGLGIATPKVALGNGVFAHFVPADPVEKVKNISRIQDDWQDVSAAELPSFLRIYGCDLRIWDVRGGQFVVLDPITGEVGPGKTWTASGATRAAVSGIKLPAVDPAPLVKAVREAVAEGIDITAADFANELARRLAS